jgi:hypothetical protein
MKILATLKRIGVSCRNNQWDPEGLEVGSWSAPKFYSDNLAAPERSNPSRAAIGL